MTSSSRRPIRGGLHALPGLFLALVFASAAAPALAHDLWLQPSSFSPEPGGPVAVRILVGHEPASAEPIPRRSGWIERFIAVGPLAPATEAGAPGATLSERPLEGVEGADPAGYFRAEEPGLHALALVSAPTEHRMTLDAFTRYLGEEGLEARAAADAGRIGTDGAVDELFSRSVKALVRVGSGESAAGWDRPLGLPFELVPLDDPFAPATTELRLRVLLHGEPASGVRIDRVALDPDAPAGSATAVSDREGVVRLPLPPATDDPAANRLLISGVVLVAPPPGSTAEWWSLWTSLTFERLRAPGR